MKKLIATTKNGVDVYLDTEHSHAATHIAHHPELLEFAKNIIADRVFGGRFLKFSTDMGGVVGNSDLVETTANDDTFYAKRPNRRNYTRFVNGKNAEPTRFVTLELRKVDDQVVLFTVYIGGATPPFPYGKDDPHQDGREFWKTHALVTGNQEYLEETVTKECPW